MRHTNPALVWSLRAMLLLVAACGHDRPGAGGPSAGSPADSPAGSPGASPGGSANGGATCEQDGHATACAPVHDAAWRLVLATDGHPPFGGLTGTPTGDAFVAWADGDSVRLARISDGSAALVKSFSIEGGTRSVFRSSPNLLRKPGGSLLLGVTAFAGLSQDTYVDLGGGRRTGSQAVELREDGSYVRTVLLCRGAYFESTSWVEDVDDDGDVLVGYWSTGADWTKLVRADGREVLLWHDGQGSSEPTLPSALPRGCFSPRFAPDGHVVCGGYGPSVAKVDREGNVSWSVDLGSGAGVADHLGVAADGTILAAGSFWGAGVAGAGGGGFVLALDPDGEPRWARQLTGNPRAIAVRPEDGAAILVAPVAPRGSADVLDVGADGSFRWRGPVAGAQAIAVAGRELVVAGALDDGSVFVQGFGR